MYDIASIDAKLLEAFVFHKIGMAHLGGGIGNRQETGNALHNSALFKVHRKIGSETGKDGSRTRPGARGPLSLHQKLAH